MKITRKELRKIINEAMGSINPFNIDTGSGRQVLYDQTFDDAKNGAGMSDSGIAYFVQPRRGNPGDEVLKFDKDDYGNIRATGTQMTADDAMEAGDGPVYVHKDAVSVDRPTT